jgi:hypothetical protein
MDSTTFSRELSKYKIVRLADHTRIRLKTIRVKKLHLWALYFLLDVPFNMTYTVDAFYASI